MIFLWVSLSSCVWEIPQIHMQINLIFWCFFCVVVSFLIPKFKPLLTWLAYEFGKEHNLSSPVNAVITLAFATLERCTKYEQHKFLPSFLSYFRSSPQECLTKFSNSISYFVHIPSFLTSSPNRCCLLALSPHEKMLF